MSSFFTDLKQLFSFIFSPDSKLELILRTSYHKLNSSKLITYIRIKCANKSFNSWLTKQALWLLQNRSATNGEKITFFLPSNSKNLLLTLNTIKSITAQRSRDWILLLAIYSDEETLPLDLNNFISDSRINVIKGPRGSLEAFIENCETNYFVMCEPGDFFSRNFLEVIQNTIQESPPPDLLSFDINILEKDSRIPLFKPFRYSPELHLSTNYLSRSVISTSAAKSHLDELDTAIGLLSQEWELLLSMCDQELNIKHIPHILMQLSSENKVSKDEHIKIIQNHLKRKFDFQSEISINQEKTKIKWNSAQPIVSLIVPTKNNCKKLISLLSSVFEKTVYPRYELIIVDTGSTDEKLFTTYESLTQKHPVKVINYQGSFNYSKANNLGAHNAKGDLLLFLNDDMQVLNEDWLSELVQWALIDEIGIVGTKLIRPNNTLQHIGIVVGLQNLVGHLYLNAPIDYYGLMGSANWYRNVSALTGACQMMRRSLFEELGGYDENYELVFSDIALCLKALKRGYRNLYTPHAALLHHEGASRGYQTPVEDILRGYEEMDEILRNGDPYFSPNLTLEPIPRCEMDSWIPGHRSQKYLERKNYYLAHRSKIGQG